MFINIYYYRVQCVVAEQRYVCVCLRALKLNAKEMKFKKKKRRALTENSDTV